MYLVQHIQYNKFKDNLSIPFLALTGYQDAISFYRDLQRFHKIQGWKKTPGGNSRSGCVRPAKLLTLNFFKLHTCVFSNFPNVIEWTIAVWLSFRTRNWGGLFVSDDHRDDCWLGLLTKIFLEKQTSLCNKPNNNSSATLTTKITKCK